MVLDTVFVQFRVEGSIQHPPLLLLHVNQNKQRTEEKKSEYQMYNEGFKNIVSRVSSVTLKTSPNR